MDIIKQAKEEVAALERAIASSQAKLDAIRLWLAQGEQLFSNGPHSTETQSTYADKAIALPRTGTPPRQILTPLAADQGQLSSKKDLVMAVVANALSSGLRMQTRALVKLVQEAGLELTGDPVQTLSVYISRDGRFETARALGGWGLKQSPHNEEPPPDVAAPAGA
jgi:hypothetical protein